MIEMTDLAILVTTFLRDDHLFRCVESIRKFYPSISVYIGDNGKPSKKKTTVLKKNKCHHLILPFDCGVGGTRNEALKRIPTKYKYIAVIEDDIIFNEKSKLETWYSILKSNPKIGIVGGLLVYSDGREQHYEGNHWISKEGSENVKYTRKITEPNWITLDSTKYYLCDLILNVFMMRKEVWKEIAWDEQFKTALEHTDWFLSLKYQTKNNKVIHDDNGNYIERENKWLIAYCPDVEVVHYNIKASQEYQRYRSRPVGFQLFAEKWNIQKGISDFDKVSPVFYDKQIKNLNYNEKDFALERAIKIFNKHNVKWWLEGGTLLGAIREDGFIGHDTDVDVGIAPRQSRLWDIFLDEFPKEGFTLYRKWVDGDRNIELSFKYNETKIDLFFFFDTKDGHYWHGAFCPDDKGRWGNYLTMIPRIHKAELFKDLQEIFFRGKRCYVPDPAEDHLAAQYGKDWRIPNKNWKYWIDNKAADASYFKKKKNVYLYGTFPLFSSRLIDVLEKIKQIGNHLIVGIFNDDVISWLKLECQADFQGRKKVLESLRIVDEVIEISAPEPMTVCQKAGGKFKPDYVVNANINNLFDHSHAVISDPRIKEIDILSDEEKELIIGKVKLTESIQPTNQIGSITNNIGVQIKEEDQTIAIGIKTFLREEVFFKTLNYIKDGFPYPYKLYIADDGYISAEKKYQYKQLEQAGHTIIILPGGSGISSGRNEIVKQVKERYILILDDDIVFKNKQSIINMKSVLDGVPDIGLVAAILTYDTGGYFAGRDYAHGLNLVRRNGLLVRMPAAQNIEKVKDGLYVLADQVPNVFLAKRELFDNVKWDSKIRVEYEHMDFFLRLKQTKWKSAVCLSAEAIHQSQINEPEYNQVRYSAPQGYFLQKHGLHKVINQYA